MGSIKRLRYLFKLMFVADPAVTPVIIAASALASTGIGVAQATRGAPSIPDPPELPNRPPRPDTASRSRASELAQRAERRRRANTLLTGPTGVTTSPFNVTKSLLGQ